MPHALRRFSALLAIAAVECATAAAAARDIPGTVFRRARGWLTLLMVVLLAGLTSPVAHADQAAGAAQCFGTYLTPRADDAAQAAALMAERVTLPPHPEVALPANPTWREDPLKDTNWQFNLHTLRWADVLRREGARTGNAAMLERHRAILQDWIADNPRAAPASPVAYGDMQTGLRAIVFACAVGTYGPETWLLDALRAHGAILIDPTFDPNVGNHSLHVRMGLLVAGAVLPDEQWRATGVARIEQLLVRSFDERGVTDEGSISYAWQNYRWYQEARSRITRAGLTPSSAFDRLKLVPEFLARATRPDGKWEQIGDTDLISAVNTRGTSAEYAATLGASGPRPSGVYDVFDRGYVFGRSGWGVERPFTQEDFYSLRFGTSDAEQVHNHRDHTSLTIHARGGQLVNDAGRGKYGPSAMRTYLGSTKAHNVVEVTGAASRPTGAAPLLASDHTATHDLTTVRSFGLSSPRTRTVLYSRTGRYFVVHDRIDSPAFAETVQRWNLPTGRTFYRTPTSVASSGTGPNVTMFWLGKRPVLSTAEGQTNPLLGWRSHSYGVYFPAPVVQARTGGTVARITTVIVPRPAGRATPIRVTSAQVVGDEVSATVENQGRVEKFAMSPHEAVISPAP